MNAPQRRKEWHEFKKWCAERRLKALPAHPWTLSVYALWLDANRRHRTLHKRLDVIARVHIRALTHSPERDPVVLRTLQTIQERRNLAPPPTQAQAFNGQELLEPKKQVPALVTPKSSRQFTQTPPLVARRPNQDQDVP